MDEEDAIVMNAGPLLSDLIVAGLGLAFVATAAWLAVRIINRKERWAKWTLATLIGPPMLYVASFGPACWWLSSLPNHQGSDMCFAPRFYLPIGWAARNGPYPIKAALSWYARLHSPARIVVTPDGRRGIWLHELPPYAD
jgi:hypothetical protein